MTISVAPGETARNELSHLVLHYLQKYLFQSEWLNGFNVVKIGGGVMGGGGGWGGRGGNFLYMAKCECACRMASYFSAARYMI